MGPFTAVVLCDKVDPLCALEGFRVAAARLRGLDRIVHSPPLCVRGRLKPSAAGLSAGGNCTHFLENSCARGGYNAVTV